MYEEGTLKLDIIENLLPSLMKDLYIFPEPTETPEPTRLWKPLTQTAAETEKPTETGEKDDKGNTGIIIKCCCSGNNCSSCNCVHNYQKQERKNKMLKKTLYIILSFMLLGVLGACQDSTGRANLLSLQLGAKSQGDKQGEERQG